METISPSLPAAERRAGRAANLARPARLPLILGGLVLIGLALRLWFIAVNQIDPRFSAADDGDYYLRALRLAATGAYVDNSWLIRPPGHIFFFAALIRVGLIFGDPAIGIGLIRAAHVAISLALIPLGYDLARRLFDARAGLIFAALLAVWFPFVELPALILSEPLFLSLLLTHCWLLVRWRDDRRLRWLALAGLALAAAALARSPGLYGALFAALFIAGEIWLARAAAPLRAQAPALARRLIIALLAFGLPFTLTIAPWTLRNYLVYGDLIIIDTLGPVNLWIAMSDAVNEGRGEAEAKATLLGIAQADRQAFVSADLRRIVAEEPWRVTRNLWPHFLHIWKAQFVEDFFIKTSAFTRPLREVWPIAALGDLLWLAFTIAAPVGLLARPREGAFRLLALGWVSYTCLMVMLAHVEPRYLLPVWLMFALYGAAATSQLWGARAAPRRGRDPLLLVGLAGSAALLALILSYRNYPQILASGLAREGSRAAAERALAADDPAAAERAYAAMLAADPDYADGRAELALLLLRAGRYDEGWSAIGDRPTHRSDLVRGALARAQGDAETAAAYLSDSEQRAGEDIQRLAMQWLTPAPARQITVGDGLDLGYLQGFALGERLPDAQQTPYRWLQGAGRIRLRLPAPLAAGDTLALRLAASAPTPLTITVGGQPQTITVQPGGWRSYQIALPASLVGAATIEIALSAPTFLPYQVNPASDDARPLSVMLSGVAVR